MLYRSLALFAVLLFLAPKLQAWNAEGHMVVSRMAYNHLNPNARAKCDSLVAVSLPNASLGTSDFVTAAVWADDFKGALGTANWHYIDLPFSLDGTSTNGFVPDSFDVVQAINLCVATLQNPNSDLTDQAMYLRYLLHFVGDIHQPLHASDAIDASDPNGDLGGNNFNLTGSYNNLHSLWDGGDGLLPNNLSRPLSASSQTTLSNLVAGIEAIYPYSPHSGSIPVPMDWALEGWNLAQTVSYVGVTRGNTPSITYSNTVQATAKQRLALGGHRLADLLNSLYPSNPFGLTSITRTNGKFSFSWSANSGQTYRIQWKQNLTDPTWNDLTNITASSNLASFTESFLPAGRFYRAAQ